MKKFINWVRTLGAPEDPVATNVSDSWSVMSLLKAIYGQTSGLSLNTRLAKTAAYPVVNADKGKTIALGGNSFYALTFSAASGYDANYSNRIVNEDSWASGRAKKIILTGGSTFLLWPTEICEVFAQNNVWYAFKRTRAKLPTGIVIFNTDVGAGSDTYGNADGLATGAGAFATVNGAAAIVANDLDWNTTNSATQVKYLMKAGTTDPTPVHCAYHGAVGAAGARGITIDGNTTGQLTGGVALYFNTIVELQNVKISNASGHGLNVTEKAVCYLQGGVDFGACSGAQILIDRGAELNVNALYNISGGGQYHMLLQTGAFVINPVGALVCTVSANVTFSQYFAFIQGPCTVDYSSITWNVGAFTVTNTVNKASIGYNGVMFGASSLPGTGSVVNPAGGQYT